MTYLYEKSHNLLFSSNLECGVILETESTLLLEKYFIFLMIKKLYMCIVSYLLVVGFNLLSLNLY